jgi:hypothetical protein
MPPPLPALAAAGPLVPPPLDPRPAAPPRRRRISVWILFPIFLLVFVLGGGAAYLLVRKEDPVRKGEELVVGPGGLPTIGEALLRARSDPPDTIRILPGTYREALRLDRKVRLVGEGPRDGVVVIGDNAPALTVEGDGGSVTGITLRCEAGPDRPKHPAVKIAQGTLEMDSCDVGWAGEPRLNRTNAGACVEVAGAAARPTLKGCQLHHGHQGLLVSDGAAPVVEDCVISNNQVGVWVDSAGGLFQKCTVRQNHAVNVFAAGRGARVELRECEVGGGEGDGVVLAMEASGDLVGGAIQEHRGRGNHAVWIKERATARLTGCDIFHNQTGIQVIEGGAAVLSTCKIHDNTGLALEVRGSDSSLDAAGCQAAAVCDNGAPWAFDDARTFRKPNK